MPHSINTNEKGSWTCPHGCSPAFICKHLEALLPSASKSSVRAVGYSNIDQVCDPDVPRGVTFQVDMRDEMVFKRRLKSYGLKPWDIEMMCLRFIDELSFREIAEDQGFTSESTCRYYYRRLVRLIKEKKNAKKKDSNL